MKILITASVVLSLVGVDGALADWPQWRGPTRDGVAPASFAPASWAKAPTRVWSVTLGGGHAAPVTLGDRVIQHFREGGNEVVAGLDLATGKTVWRDAYPVSYSPKSEAMGHGLGPFATPVISEGRVFTFGITEILSAYDVKTGKRLWRKDWSGELQTPYPYYGTSASPLVADGKVIVYVGEPGKGALVALDVASGAIRWRLDGDGPPYGAAVMATFASVRQVVTQTQATIQGVDVATGARLWQRPFKVAYDNTILTPVIDGDVVLISADDVDLQAFRVSKAGARWTSADVWRVRQPMHMSSPVLANGRLYGMTTLRRGQIFGLDSKAGKVLWSSPGGVGEQAALIVVGTKLLVLSDDGVLQVLEVGDAHRPVARHTVADEAVWAPPALLSGGRFLVKSATKLTLWSFGT